MPGFFLCRLFAMTKVRHSTTQTPGYSLSSMDQSLPPRKDRTFAMVKPHQIETVSGFGLIQLSLIWQCRKGDRGGTSTCQPYGPAKMPKHETSEDEEYYKVFKACPRKLSCVEKCDRDRYVAEDVKCQDRPITFLFANTPERQRVENTPQNPRCHTLLRFFFGVEYPSNEEVVAWQSRHYPCYQKKSFQ